MPADTDIIVSQLPSATSLSASDLIMVTQPNAQAETGYDTKKALLELLAKKIVNGLEYETLLADFPQGKRNATDALEYLLDFIIGQLPVSSASGPIADFETPIELPLVSLKANITAQQAGTGTPSPQNERPITGLNSVHINYVDFNQLIKNGDFNGSENWSKNGSATTFSVSNNTAILTSTTNNGGIYSSNVYLVENHKYFYSFFAKNSNTLNCGFSQFTEGRKTISASTTSKRYTYIGTPTSSGNGQFAFYNSGNVENNFEIKNVNFIDLTQAFGSTIADYLYTLEQGSAGSGVALFRKIFYKDYYAYSVGGSLVTVASVNDDTFPDSAVINLGDTYYGGVLDVKNGTATITHKATKVKDLTWSKGSGGNTTRFYSNAVADILPPETTSSAMPDIKAESYATIANFNRIFYDDLSIGINTNKAINITDSNYTTADAFKTAMGECLIVYPLATPITLSGLTPDNFTTIAGQNNIFADSGDVELSFKQGIQEYIDAKIAETQALIL